MGLLLGASVVTVFELLDVLIYNGIRKCLGVSHHQHNSKSDSDMSISENNKQETIRNSIFFQ